MHGANEICVCGHAHSQHSLGGGCHECTCGYFYSHQQEEAVAAHFAEGGKPMEEICVCGHMRSEHCDIQVGNARSSSCEVEGCNCHFFYRDQRTVDQLLEEAQEIRELEPIEKQLAARRKEPFELQTALLHQLHLVLAKPFNAKMLKELESTARLARELLIVSGGKGAKLRRRTLGYLGEDGGVLGGFEGDDLEPANVPPAETFGSASIRELVSALKDQNKPRPPSILMLVEALGVAKREGLTEVAQDLERQIKDMQRKKDCWDESREAFDAAVVAAKAGETP